MIVINSQPIPFSCHQVLFLNYYIMIVIKQFDFDSLILLWISKPTRTINHQD